MTLLVVRVKCSDGFSTYRSETECFGTLKGVVVIPCEVYFTGMCVVDWFRGSIAYFQSESGSALCLFVSDAIWSF